MKDTIILGVHYAHDATAALMINGEIVEAMSEERLTRLKKYTGFPKESVRYIKKKYNIETFPTVIVVGEPEHAFDAIFSDKESNERSRKQEKKPQYFMRSIGFRFYPLGVLFSLYDWLREKKSTTGAEKRVRAFIAQEFPGSLVEYVPHHLAHAYAAVPFISKTNKTLILTCDGAGDNLSASVNMYENGKMSSVAKTKESSSLGYLYAAMTDFMGMNRNEHEFKVMGLAPYAKPASGEKVYNLLRELIWLDRDTLTFSSKYNMRNITPYFLAKEYFLYRFDSLAYGIQKLTEELLTQYVDSALKKYEVSEVALGGGVFMNVKANQKILELPSVKNLTVTPSCGDESLALGACVYGHSKFFDYKNIKKIDNLYLGSEYTQEEVHKAIEEFNFTVPVDIKSYDRVKGESIEEVVGKLLSENNVVGRFSGRAEWGARALGNRSILANPLSRDNVKVINEMIKNRDFWMPFATSLIEEDASVYLHNEKMESAPFMAITFETKEKAHKELTAALHPYDMTSRPQTVSRQINKKYYELISHFKSITGVGGILNTSFNLHGEPNVETPYDALRTFDLSGMRYLAIGDYLISKK